MASASPQSPIAVARFFLDKASADSIRDLTPMKVMKLAYLAHGWTLAYTDNPLLSQNIEAWQYGPVVRSLYRYFREFGGSPIPFSEALALPAMKTDERTTAIVDAVWNAYKNHTGLQLSAETHREGSPWYKTWFDLGGSRTKCATIDNLIIRDYFKSLIAPSNH